MLELDQAVLLGLYSNSVYLSCPSNAQVLPGSYRASFGGSGNGRNKTGIHYMQDKHINLCMIYFVIL